MENRFEHTPPEEQQGWGAYATPPPYPGQKQKSQHQPAHLPSLPQDLTMCSRVKEKLPFLMENADGEISPEMVKALYGHLSVCEDCAREFDEQQRVISYLEAMPPVELPMDFTNVIQRRIQMQGVMQQNDGVVVNTPGPVAAATETSIKKRSLTERTPSVTRQRQTQITTTRQVAQTQSNQMTRLAAGSITAGIMAYFLSTAWGREMLGENVVVVRAWLEQVGTALSRIPLLGRLAALILAALTQMGDLLGDTYRTVGDMAVRGMAMDVAICMAAYYFLVTRRQRPPLRRV